MANVEQTIIDLSQLNALSEIQKLCAVATAELNKFEEETELASIELLLQLQKELKKLE